MAEKRMYLAIGIIVLMGLALASYYAISKYIRKPIVLNDDFENSEILFERNINGYSGYRIPALISLPNQTLIAFAEARKDSMSDYGNIDIVMRKSEDGGKTWGKMQLIWDNGELAVQNPSPVYDNETKTLFLLVAVDRKETYILNSNNMGKTWSEPKLISGIFPENWNFKGPSPGKSIQLQSGRLLVSGMYNVKDENKEVDWGSFYMYSDDHGGTWWLGHVFDFGTNECQSTQLINGTVYTILRQNSREGKMAKMVALSNDGGLTASNPTYNEDLVSPVVMSSILQHPEGVVIYSGPNNPSERKNLAIKLSYNGGKMYSASKTIYEKWSVYSDLAITEDNKVCCLFECGANKKYQSIAFIKTTLYWLESPT